MARVDEIVDGIYRICTTVQLPDTEFQFSQFLIDDERPALVHTGMHGLYEGVRDGIAEVLDPGKLEYVILLHFEADENGGMDRFLAGAPNSTLACSASSVILNRDRVDQPNDPRMSLIGTDSPPGRRCRVQRTLRRGWSLVKSEPGAARLAWRLVAARARRAEFISASSRGRRSGRRIRSCSRWPSAREFRGLCWEHNRDRRRGLVSPG